MTLESFEAILIYAKKKVLIAYEMRRFVYVQWMLGLQIDRWLIFGKS
jgi:hypothetical protein